MYLYVFVYTAYCFTVAVACGVCGCGVWRVGKEELCFIHTSHSRQVISSSHIYFSGVLCKPILFAPLKRLAPQWRQ